MKSHILIAGIIAALLTSSCSKGEAVDSVVRIYYVPIGVETYAQITVENVEMHGSYVELSTDDKRYTRLISIIDRAPAGFFDESMVRVKIATGGDTMYIDNSGGLKLPVSTKKLSPAELSDANKILDSLSKQ